jgi:hypothetical protein
MEDYFGYNKFGDPRRAFKAYYEAFKEEDRPQGAAEHYDLGLAMLTYFLEWYPVHNTAMEFQTLWLTENNMVVEPNTPGARPAVEESFTLDLAYRVAVNKKTGELLCEYNEDTIHRFASHKIESFLAQPTIAYYMVKDLNNVDIEPIEIEILPVCYHGTFDRLVVDKYGRWWILDYKTAKGADTNKLDTDDQISAYMWAAEQWYQHPIYGFIYVQLTKDVAKPPRRLKDGTLSVDKKQKTTYRLFKQELLEEFGEVRRAPGKYIEMLNHLAEQETPEGDRFIRWDLITRSDAQKISTYRHIMAEVRMMIDPTLYLFPNPTRDCIWDCPFREACIAIDDDRMDDAKQLISLDFEARKDSNESNHDDWRNNIKWPEEALPAADINDLTLTPSNIFNIELPPEYTTGIYEEE